ncbi:AAA family ATPase [Brevibacterium moorei]|uniref:AAA family ATPase n=1 Tax=Brevibacterium moorei TaxID=2968457 RepID=UPI00211CDCB9|nr:AAA family ATPase [Brevibacterium sp. 68QC2CO]MCQ9386348.1 AAA family ATPase [Brevibacterium sp. 68QC2CO]
MDFKQPPVVRISRDTTGGAENGSAGAEPGAAYPYSIPAVAQLLTEGLTLDPGVTFLVGENGSGKSTILEGIALAFGFAPEGGSIHSQHSTWPSESDLYTRLYIQRGIGTKRWGFFLRSETTHSLYTYLEEVSPGTGLHQMSHGESYLELFSDYFSRPGFYCMDEPEAALSFGSTLRLLRILDQIRSAGGQALIATHSPILASLPGATVIEVGDWGMRQVQWRDLELVDHWCRYLQAPERYLRHLLD